MNFSLVSGFLFLVMQSISGQEQKKLVIEDSTIVQASFINRGTTLINKLDTLWILNGVSFSKYRSAYRLLFSTQNLNGRLFRSMEERDSLKFQLNVIRKQAYEDLIKLNREFSETTGRYLQENQDHFVSMQQNLQEAQSKIASVHANLESAREEIRKASQDKWWFLVLGAVGGAAIATIVK